jgi:HprK-related kinase A
MVGESVIDHGLDRQLAGPGIRFRVGPFTAHVRTSFKAVRRDFLQIYKGFPLAGAGDVTSLHLQVRATSLLRRWIRPKLMADTGFANTPFVPLPGDLGILAMEMGLNWLVATTSDRFLMFHAGMVAKGDKAILMPGASGMGKSTLTAGMSFSGWRFFTDEFGLFDPLQGLFYPHPRPISLKNESIPILAERVGESYLSRPLYNTPKGTIRYIRPPAEALARMTEPARPSLILYPTFNSEATGTVEELPPHEAFAMLRGAAINCDRLGETAFRALADLTSRTRSLRLEYRSLDQALAMVSDLMDIAP